MKIPDNVTFVDTPEHEARLREWGVFANVVPISIDFTHHKLLTGQNFNTDRALSFMAETHKDWYVVRRGANKYDFMMPKGPYDDHTVERYLGFQWDVVGSTVWEITVGACTPRDPKDRWAKGTTLADKVWDRAYKFLCDHKGEWDSCKYESGRDSDYWYTRWVSFCSLDGSKIEKFAQIYGNIIESANDKCLKDKAFQFCSGSRAISISIRWKAKGKDRYGDWGNIGGQVEIDNWKMFTPNVETLSGTAR
jgi:hypothetical protein